MSGLMQASASLRPSWASAQSQLLENTPVQSMDFSSDKKREKSLWWGKDEEKLRQAPCGQEEREYLTEAGRDQKMSARPCFMLRHLSSLYVFFFHPLAGSVTQPLSFFLRQQRTLHLLLVREGHGCGPG